MFPSWRAEVSPRRLTRGPLTRAFAVWLGLVTGKRPRAHPVPYLPCSVPPRAHARPTTAVPPYISGRTSYLRVRLEFLPYPQVIPQFCNTGEFEPRRTVTSASLCPWIAHVVSGRIVATTALFRLGFPLAPQLYRWLTTQQRITRRIILQKARHQPLVALATVASDCW